MKLATLRDGTRDGRAGGGPPRRCRVRRAHDVAARSSARSTTGSRRARAARARRTSSTRGDRRRAPRRAAARTRRCRAPTSGSTARRSSTTCILVRKARGAEPPPTLETDPLVYQGGSGDLLGPSAIRSSCATRPGASTSSREVCVVLGDMPMGTKAAEAGRLRAARDARATTCTLRNLIPDELAKGFGFFQSKPATAFSPFAVTPDELGAAWRDGRAHVRVRVDATTARWSATCDAGPEMHFSFFDLHPAHREDARLHRGHDPRQRHVSQRGPRARHLVPRRARG